MSRIRERHVGARRDGLVVELGEGTNRQEVEVRFEGASPDATFP